MPTSKSQTISPTALILLGTVLLVGLFIWSITPMLTAFIVGLIIAYLMNPAVETLDNKGLPRTWASLIALLGFYLALFSIIGLLIPLGIREGFTFLGEQTDRAFNLQTQLQQLLAQMESLLGISLSLGTVVSYLAGVGEHLLNGLFSTLGSMVAAGVALGDIFALLLITPLVAFYMLREWPQITTFIQSLIPKKQKKETLSVLNKMDTKIAGFVRGQAMVCLAQGVFLGLTLQFVAGLQLGFVMGMVTGILAFIPIVGGLIGTILTLLIALIQFGVSGWEPYAIILAIFFINSLLENFILTPKFVGDGVGLHPLWVIFALMAGAQLAGVVGMLLAVPIAAIISELLPLALKTWRNSNAYQGK